MSLMGANGTQQKQRQNERQQKREERKSQGMSDEEILKLEAEEDVQAEEEALKKSTGSTVQDLEVNHLCLSEVFGPNLYLTTTP